MKIYCAVCSLVVFTLFSSSAFTASKDKSDSLLVYAVVFEYARAVAEAFTKQTGVEVNVVKMKGSGATLARIRVEKTGKSADVWFGGSIGAHVHAADEGLLVKHKPKNYLDIFPRIRNPAGNYTTNGLYAGILGFVINAQYLKDKGVPIPSSWSELAHPQYKGMIGMKSPLVSGTAFTTLITVVKIMGEEKAFNYLKRLHKNIQMHSNDYNGRVIAGSMGIAITFFHEAVQALTVSRSSIRFIMPSEGMGYEIGGLSLIKKGSNRSRAMQFIDFAMSQQGQALMPKDNNQIPSHQCLKSHSPNMTLENAKLIDLDFKWAGENRQRLLERWRKEVVN